MKPSHGTTARYQQGCHCARCRRAWATYIRDRARKGGRRPAVMARAAARMGLPRTARVRPAFYAGKAVALTVRVTPLARRLLEAAWARTGHDWDDIVERLLRERAATVAFEDTDAAA